MTDLTIPEAVDVLRQWRVDTHRHTLDLIATAVDVLTEAIPAPDAFQWHPTLVVHRITIETLASEGTFNRHPFSATEVTYMLEEQEIDGVPMVRGKITTDWRPANV